MEMGGFWTHAWAWKRIDRWQENLGKTTVMKPRDLAPKAASNLHQSLPPVSFRPKL